MPRNSKDWLEAVLFTHNQTFTEINTQPVLEINGNVIIVDPLFIQGCKEVDPGLAFF